MLNRGTLVGLIALAAALVVAIPANADHATVGASLTINNGEKEVVLSSALADCTTTNCLVQVPVAKRDVGRVSRWCGAASVSIILDSSLPANTGVSETCSGGGSWTATIVASRNSTHAEDVTVEVVVVEQL